MPPGEAPDGRVGVRANNPNAVLTP